MGENESTGQTNVRQDEISPYVLGIDGGATKTECVVMDGEGQVLGRGSGGASNFYSVGVEAAQTALCHAITSACREAGVSLDQIAAVCLGMAGADRPDDTITIRAMIEDIAVFPVVRIEHDALAALVGGVGRREGVVIIAGTGAIAYGVNAAGQEWRASGRGPLLADEGSGYDIALRALKAATRADDGRGPATDLGPRILAFLGLEKMEDLGTWAYREPHTWERFAQLAPVVIQVAAEGDAVARDILRTGGRELGLAVVAVIKGLRLTEEAFPIVLAGGVLLARPPDLLQTLKRTVLAAAPRADIRFPRHDPAIGAGLLALEALGERI